MDPKKDDLNVCEYPIEEGQVSGKELDDVGIITKYRGTAADKRYMLVLGKKQVLRVYITQKRTVLSQADSHSAISSSSQWWASRVVSRQAGSF